MKGGHNRLPTAIKALRGSLRADRVTNEPQPAPLRARCPSWLPPRAKKAWRYLAPRLIEQGVLRETDFVAFVMMLLHLDLALQAAEVLARQGILVADPDHLGALRKHPAAQVFRDNSAAFGTWAARFGLTPADRGRVAVVAQEEEPDPLRLFLLKGGRSELEQGGDAATG